MQNDDIRWFLNNYTDIYRKYGKCFLAIKNEVVLGKYKSPMEAFTNEVKKSVDPGTFIVMECKSKKTPTIKQITVNNIMIG